MRILLLNSILFTAENNIIPQVKSIKDTMIYNMCLGFLKLGHNITLAAAKEYVPTESEIYDFEILFFPSQHTRIFPPSALPYSPALKTYLRKNHTKFDLIISSEVFSFNSLFATQICPEKTIIWHELALHPSKFYKIPSKIWYNIIAPHYIKKARIIIPRSDNAKKFILQYFKNVSSQCIEHGINTKQFSFSEKKKKQFIYVGQLIPRKNIKSIIDKFSQFIHQYDSEYQLLIVGRGILEETLKAYVNTYKLNQHVQFIGFVDHTTLNKLLMDSQAMLINTLQDNNMVSIPESIVSGTPIITNPIPTNSSTINENKLGIVKKEWNQNDLYEITCNNALYVNNCIEYRKKLTNEYSAQLFINEFEKLHS